MGTFNHLIFASKGILAIFFAVLLGACSYTPEEQAKFDERRAFWEQNNGYGGTNR